MKKAFLLLHDIFALFVRETKIIILIVISLSFSIGISFSMIAYCSNEMQFLEEVAYDRVTYSFYYNIPYPEQYEQDPNFFTAIEAFDNMFFTDKLPQVRGSYDTLAFHTFYDYGLEGGWDAIWKPYFEEDFVLYEDKSEELLTGRWFTNSQLSVNNLVAVVSKKDYPQAKEGDFIELFEQEIEVIGILEEDNYLPYGLMLELSNKERGFAPYSFDCTFSKPLSDQQIEDINAHSSVSITWRFDMKMGNYVSNILLMLAVVMGIFLIIMLNMLNLFKHIINKSKYRFMVIKVCGGGKSLVYIGLYLVPLLIAGVAFLFGLLLHLFLVNPILIDILDYPPLTALDYLFAFFLTLFFAFIVLLPTVKRIAKAQPVSVELWR